MTISNAPAPITPIAKNYPRVSRPIQWALTFLVTPLVLVACGGGGSDDVPAGTNTSAACFSFDKPYTTGNRWTYSYANGQTTYEARGEGAYKGKMVYRLGISGNSSGASFSQGKYISNSNGIDYVHGYENSSGLIFTLVEYSPVIATPRSIALNHPNIANYTRERNINIGGVHETVQVVQTTSYLGRETVQTQFGSFETCKMEYRFQENGGQPVVNTDWVIASGKLTGLVAQSQSQGNTTQPLNIEVSW